MKVAIVGSRGLFVKVFSPYLPSETAEIVSGGAQGIDQCAAAYAKAHGLALTEFKPDYKRYGKGAPLKRNLTIVDYANFVLIFWDGVSRGSRFVIDACEKSGKPHRVVRVKTSEPAVAAESEYPPTVKCGRAGFCLAQSSIPRRYPTLTPRMRAR